MYAFPVIIGILICLVIIAVVFSVIIAKGHKIELDHPIERLLASYCENCNLLKRRCE